MKGEEIQYLYEAGGRIFYRSFFNEIEVIWSQDVDNPHDLLISADSCAKMLGYGSAEEMLAYESFLDLINLFMKETGSPFPVVVK